MVPTLKVPWAHLHKLSTDVRTCMVGQSGNSIYAGMLSPRLAQDSHSQDINGIALCVPLQLEALFPLYG